MYDIADDQRETQVRLAIMFFIPFDYTQNENLFALGFFRPNEPCSETLYDLMFNKQGTFSRANTTGSGISYTSNGYKVMGNMTSISKSMMKVELWD